jgi:protein phosphatase
MIVMGGRTNTVGEDVPMEVYDTESSEWYKFNAVQRFRHTCWQVDGSIYVHGGFEHDNPNVPINAISKIDSNKLFANFSGLISKISPKLTVAQTNDKKAKDKKKNQNIYQIGENPEFKLAN